MRRLAMTVVLLAVAAIAAPVSATPPANPFAGAWNNVDVADGSNQTITVGNGVTIRVQYRDDGGTVCVQNGYGFVRLTANGPATLVDADTLEFGPADIYCYPSGGGPVLALSGVVVTFDYDAGTNTLSDSFGNCWHRPSDPAACLP